MKTLSIKGSTGTSQLLVGESLDQLPMHLAGRRTIIITNETVKALYGERFGSAPVLTVGEGEGHKTLETVGRLYDALVDLEADRTTFVVGIGGGIVCDITGFVASTYMRGMPFGFVATTLLAQVDASVGGKNGVNFGGYKNMVGVFNQPEFVICDLTLLSSLPRREVLCGLTEIVKHALIADAAMFDFLESHWRAALDLKPAVVQRLVYDSVVIKAEVVNQDEKEQGRRRILNFGHTTGHALEKLTGLPHGEAVSIGMAVAAAISRRRGLLPQEQVERITGLLSHLGLPTRLPVSPQQIGQAMRKDKKRAADKIHFILLDRIGRAKVQALTIEELQAHVIETAP
jgi:3-dehydroquinate synthase